MFKMTLFLFTTGLVLTGSAAADAGILEEARAEAEAQNKPVLVDFYTDWCKYCKRFDKDAIENAEVIEVLDRFVLVKINAEKQDGPEVAKAHKIQGFPTFIATNGKGTTLGRWAGYETTLFLKEARGVLDDPTTIEEKRARYESSPTAQDAARLASFHETRGELEEALSLYESAQKLNQDPETDYTMLIFQTVFTGAREEVFSEQQLIASADAVFSSARVDEKDLLLAARMMLYHANGVEKPEMAVTYIQAAVERTADSEDLEVQKSRRGVLPDYALRVEKDEAKAVAYKKDSLPKGWVDDATQLNSFAWWCFENKVNLDEAYTLAQRGVELGEPGSEKAQVLDTLAEICAAKGDCREAVALIQQAIEEDPDRKYFQKQLERFQELLAQQQGVH